MTKTLSRKLFTPSAQPRTVGEPVSLSPRPWMRESACLQICEAFAAADQAVRFVGGCVRDSLLGRAISDIDLCTPARPEETMALMEKAGIKTIPTGLQHGTITAVAEGTPFEITTLRRDVATDGRHADVAFTDDWKEDAARRDFTFNALSLTPDGLLYDYFGGQSDLKKGLVRFIGQAEQRIQEDYLRILRFFRFYAWYGHTPYGPADIDRQGLAACSQLATGMEQLSVERIAVEICKLLNAPVPMPALRALGDSGILGCTLHSLTPDALEVLAPLITLEGIGPGKDPLRRLAGLISEGERKNEAMRLKLSGQQRDRLAILDDMPPLSPPLDRKGLRTLLYRFGARACMDRLLINQARAQAETAGLDHLDIPAWKALQDEIRRWEPKQFPLSGKDVLALGFEKGPGVGALLRKVEAWWIEQDFAPDPDACRDMLRLLSRDSL